MSAARQYFSARDIQEMLSVSRAEANRILHMFEARGQMYTFGERVLRVKVKDFEAWAQGCASKDWRRRK